MQGDIVAQGVELMLFGMGTVVVFLALLVVTTAFMSGFISRYFPEPEAPAVPARQLMRGQVPTEGDPNLIPAIIAAVHQFRNKRN